MSLSLAKTLWKVVVDDLHKRKVCSQFVLNMLTQNKKSNVLLLVKICVQQQTIPLTFFWVSADFLFPKLKSSMKGCHFDPILDIKTMTCDLKCILETKFYRGILKLYGCATGVQNCENPMSKIRYN